MGKLIETAKEFPLIPLGPKVMVLPGMQSYVKLAKTAYENLANEVIKGRIPYIFAVMNRPGMTQSPEMFYNVGVVAKIEVSPQDKTAILHGQYRAKAVDLHKVKGADGYWMAEVEPYTDLEDPYYIDAGKSYRIREEHEENLRGQLLFIRGYLEQLVAEIIGEAIEKGNDVSDHYLINILDNFDGHDFHERYVLDVLLWSILDSIPSATVPEKQKIIATRLIMERLHGVARLLYTNVGAAVQATRFREKIEDELLDEITPVKDKNNPSKKDKTRLVKDRQAIEFAKDMDAQTLERWKRYRGIKESIPPDVQKAIMEDFDHLKSSPTGHSEWGTYIKHLDFLLDLYSTTSTEQEKNIANVKKILEQSHHGLNDIKQKIYQFIASKILNPQGKSPTLCLIGPPGVGKTSNGQSIADALGRKFIRLSLGGLKDEAEIKGHRLTYIGAIPGRILEMIRRSGVRNPVFMLDEIDKISTDFKGDPSSALLEVLDPEQNHSFQDHYAGAPFNLQDVFFICTANVASNIQPALRDRMTEIRLPGYMLEEKIQIANQFLIPKLMREVGLEQNHVKLTWENNDQNGLVSKIVTGYTREAGVRQLGQKIRHILESFALEYLEMETKPTELMITQALINKYLRMPFHEERANITEPGEAIGLAWTAVGGEIIYVHAQWTPRNLGDKTLSMTGSSGDVMFKANKTALTVAKNIVEKIDSEKLKKFDSHMLHVQANDASTPTDGPSAGITVAMAIVSEIMEMPIKPYMAMSGELTPKGRIRAVGGIKEKVLAAYRDGIREIILPKNNERDVIQDVPEKVKSEINFHYVEDADEAVPIAIPGVIIPRSDS